MRCGFSKKCEKKACDPAFSGMFTKEEALEKRMRFVQGTAGDPLQGPAVSLYWLVDEEDGIIADAKFQAFGSLALIGAMDALCELTLRKNHDQASRIGADLIDQHLRDKNSVPAFPEEFNADLNLAISALDEAVRACSDIPYAASYESTPIAFDFPSDGPFPGFELMTKDEKLKVIEEVTDKEIRPYIELDAGGIEIHDLSQNEVFISYQGSCTSCYASTGSTLSAVQNILRARVHPELTVTPILQEN